MKYFAKIGAIAVFVLLISPFFIGCAPTDVEEPSEAQLRIKAARQIPDYLEQAFTSVGNSENWMSVKQIDTSAVATFYLPDQDSYYLTEHLYEIQPWHRKIKITAVEPYGTFVWELSDKGFKTHKRPVSQHDLPYSINPQTIANSVMQIITAPVRLADKAEQYARSSEPTRMMGLWYYAIEGKKTAKSDIVYYQNRNTSRIDWILLKNQSGRSYAIRAYDYSVTAQPEIQVPALVEIYTTDSRGQLDKRILKLRLSQTQTHRKNMEIANIDR